MAGCSSAALPPEGKIAGLYDLERTLGKGHFAVVKLARHVFTGERVAVKVIDKSKLDAGAAAQLVQEVRCMKLVQHPHVVRLYEVIDTQAKLYLVLELGDGGDMFDHILHHEGGLAEAQAKHYFAQVVHAIAYCHRLHVVHRDLKPENVVFFRQQRVVKLTDFGFSHCFQPGTLLDTSCGSLAYSAPEILLGDQYDAPAVDVWSLGVILYMLVCGHPPFQEANDSETLTMILDCRYVVPPRVSSQCADLISRMLQRDPHQRASLEEIESHPWLQGVDPSPASRSLLPLTSHHRLSEQEHAIILQAMMGGQIADRETIQEALEANCYNHVTATYFLLAERLLREKQERQKPGSPSLVYDLAQQIQSRGASSPPSEPASEEGQRPPPLPDSKSALESLAEPSDHGLRYRLRGDPSSSSDYLDCGQPFRALLQPSLLETPLAKSTPALQQISEEGEGEEEAEGEEEGPKPGLFRRRSSSLNQEQMSHFQSSKASWLFCRGLGPRSRAGKSLAKAGAPKAGAPKPGLESSLKVGSDGGSSGSLARPEEKAAPQACKRDPAMGSKKGGQDSSQGVNPSPCPLPCHGGSPAQVAEGEGAPKGSEAGEEEKKGALSPKALVRHSGTSREARMGKPPPEPEEGQAHPPAPPELPKPSIQESQGTENGVKLDPGKGKSPHLKDRLLQFPLCEKALAFRMRPTSKESLLSLSQFNCCHVI